MLIIVDPTNAQDVSTKNNVDNKYGQTLLYAPYITMVNSQPISNDY